MPAAAERVEEALDRAAREIARADALVVTAGAGMGVDSGLPDFRGTEGFWRAYPPFARLGLRFDQMANPVHFARDPELAWGFYGHRLGLYRSTRPHEGFARLHRWAERAPAGSFVFTSNVDGHFQRAGFPAERVVECHGSILHLQCSEPCCEEVWSAEDVDVTVDESTFRAREPLPECPACGAVARPNVLMFGDWLWLPRRTGAQEERFRRWLDGLSGRLAVVEVGAGTAVPTVRLTSEHVVSAHGSRGGEALLVRINPREPQVPEGHVSIPMGGLDALREIDRRLSGTSGASGGAAKAGSPGSTRGPAEAGD